MLYNSDNYLGLVVWFNVGTNVSLLREDVLPLREAFDPLLKIPKPEMLNHMHLRSVIKDALENKLDGVWLNSGTYFIKLHNQERLDIFSNFIESIDGCGMHYLPLVSDDKQALMLFVALTEKSIKIEKQFNKDFEEFRTNKKVYQLKKLRKYISKIESIEKDVHSLNYGYALGISWLLKEKLERYKIT